MVKSWPPHRTQPLQKQKNKTFLPVSFRKTHKTGFAALTSKMYVLTLTLFATIKIAEKISGNPGSYIVQYILCNRSILVKNCYLEINTSFQPEKDGKQFNITAFRKTESNFSKGRHPVQCRTIGRKTPVGKHQEKMRGQRGRLPVQPLGYVMSTKFIFRRAEVCVQAEVCFPRRPHAGQPRSDV